MFILNWFIKIIETIINFHLFSTHTISEIEGSDTSRKICVRCPIKILAGKLGRKNLRSRLIYIAPINMIIFPWRVAYTHSTIYMHFIYSAFFVFSHLVNNYIYLIRGKETNDVHNITKFQRFKSTKIDSDTICSTLWQWSTALSIKGSDKHKLPLHSCFVRSSSQ